ncbi:Hypothetical predicted protein [Mytilus galloprovincialis]|uniref:Uncharacterized protein n=1 Tax=Mytilus galloprovincialis TaxID=29158 RepID=A0A8B6DB14_MYTGA|nr:Hypothetical predicted protein [Mytilus galloprovincialis]
MKSYMTDNNNCEDTSEQNGGVPEFSGCIEHTQHSTTNSSGKRVEQQVSEGMRNIDKTGLQGKLKAWIYQHGHLCCTKLHCQKLRCFDEPSTDILGNG